VSPAAASLVMTVRLVMPRGPRNPDRSAQHLNIWVRQPGSWQAPPVSTVILSWYSAIERFDSLGIVRVPRSHTCRT
jgi:hypothetical protein